MRNWWSSFKKEHKLPHTSASTYDKRGYTAVSQFILTVSLQGGSLGLGSKAKRVEESDRGKATSKDSVKVSTKKARAKDGSGRAKKSDEGSSELHF